MNNGVYFWAAGGLSGGNNVNFTFCVPVNRKYLTPLIKSIITFDMKHNAEIQACDLCLEIDELNFLMDHLDSTNFARVCHYLISCASYR